ncbi:MAG: hypothetical protein RR816_07980 [Clostridia bacterium]
MPLKTPLPSAEVSFKSGESVVVFVTLSLVVAAFTLVLRVPVRLRTPASSCPERSCLHVVVTVSSAVLRTV